MADLTGMAGEAVVKVAVVEEEKEYKTIDEQDVR